jgi:opacity protein-like surface antigen
MKKLFVILAIIGVAALTIGDANAAVGLRSVGIGAGYTSPENIDATWSAGLYMDVGVPVTNMYVQPFVNYWSYEEGITGASASFTDWSIGGNVKYVIPTSAPKFHPYVQGGIAAHLLSAETEINLFGQSQSFSVSDTKIGVQGAAGAAFDLTERVGLFGQGTYSLVEDFSTWTVGGGLQLNL